MRISYILYEKMRKIFSSFIVGYFKKIFGRTFSL